MPTIPKGRHRPIWPTWGILFDPQIMRRKVWFDKSCRYALPGIDQLDANKIFGWGYFDGGHHKDSARWGWHFNPLNGKIHLHAYCYTNGRRTNEDVYSVNVGEWVELEIRKYELYYVFRVDGVEVCRMHTGRHRKRWAYPLGAYFGGQHTAPHDVVIKMKRP